MSEATDEEREAWERAKRKMEESRKSQGGVKIEIDRTAELKELQKSEYAFDKIKEELAKSYAKRGEFLDPSEIKDYEDFVDKVDALREIDKIRDVKSPAGSVPLDSQQIGDVGNEGKDLAHAEFENPEDAVKFLEDVSKEDDNPQTKAEAKRMLSKLTADVLRKQAVEGREWVFEGRIAGEKNRKKTKSKWRKVR